MSLSPSAAAFALATMFPTYFVLAATLAQSREMSFLTRLFVGAMITALVFCGIPWGISLFHRVRTTSGFGFVRPKLSSLVAAGLLGLVLWPAAHELFLVNEQIGINSVRLDQLAEVKALLDQLQNVSLVWVILALAVVPGVCEEFFFRGVLFSSLRSVSSPWRTIIGAAVIFGLFHVIAGTILAPERFLPSTFLGLVLGWVRLRTGSVLPCMLLHAMHNALVLSVVHWQNELAARGFGVEEATHLPATWLIAAGIGTLLAVAWMILSTRPVEGGLAISASAT